MSEEQSVVRWGDIIRIHGVTQRSGQENKGLIMSKG